MSTEITGYSDGLYCEVFSRGTTGIKHWYEHVIMTEDDVKKCRKLFADNDGVDIEVTGIKKDGYLWTSNSIDSNDTLYLCDLDVSSNDNVDCGSIPVDLFNALT